MSNWIFLSYPLNDKAFGYGNGERFKLNRLTDISKGNTSNNTSFQMPTHYATHIDFPFHFSMDGKKSTEYKANEFIFNKPSIIEINANEVNDYLISNKDLLQVKQLPKNTDLLIVKSGFCNKRYTEDYWKNGLGFHKETASFLSEQLPNLRAVAFDLISLNSYQNREHGREAHKEFLSKHNILIVEEMDLTQVSSQTKFKQVIISPLMLEEADGAPVTVFAEII
jgi:arylformamidase